MALTIPMSAFRTLIGVRMQCSFRRTGAVVLAAPILNLHTSTDGFLCPSAEGATGLLCVRTHTCGYARIPVVSLAAAAGVTRRLAAQGPALPVVDWGESLLGSDALFGQDDHFRLSPHADPTPLLSRSACQEVLDGYCTDLRGRFG